VLNSFLGQLDASARANLETFLDQPQNELVYYLNAYNGDRARPFVDNVDYYQAYDEQTAIVFAG
jgi:hypothetical protein